MKIGRHAGYALCLMTALAVASPPSHSQETKTRALQDRTAVGRISVISRFEQKEEDQKKTSFGSLQKSLLIPGWGQIAEKRYIEGAIFLGAEVFCLAKIFSYIHKGSTQYDLYKSADNMEDAARYRKSTEKNDGARNQYILAAFGVWAVNLVDIYVIVKGRQDKQKSLRFWLEWSKEPKTVCGFSYRF